MTKFIIKSCSFLLLILVCACSVKNVETEDWALGPFLRPDGANPIIEPSSDHMFLCPMRDSLLCWEESDTFNPAATVKDGKIVVLYRAEDNTAQGIGTRTSRIGYAESTDGITMKRNTTPVLYPDKDNMKQYEWPGGCEDPRVTVTEDGLYVMLYTSWNKDMPRLAVATSRDLISWEKHGLAFAKAYNGKFVNRQSKSASIITTIKNDALVMAKINGKYIMYWGEEAVYAAVSDDLVNWEPIVDSAGNLKELIVPRDGFFDSLLTECGPPAILTDKGIILIYNGKNHSEASKADTDFPLNTYCGGQVLFDVNDYTKVLSRLDKPFFYPEADFEKSGQYVAGTVFLEGLVYYKKQWFMYYGCADSKVAVAICK